MDEERNIITVTTDDGKTYEADVIDIFNVEGYPGKDYILYSFGEEVDEDNEKVYMSILKEEGDGYLLESVKDPEEIKAVEEAVDELLSMSDEELDELESEGDEEDE